MLLFLKVLSTKQGLLTEIWAFKYLFFLEIISQIPLKTAAILKFCCKPHFSYFDMILGCTAKIFQDNYRNKILCYLSGKEKNPSDHIIFQTTCGSGSDCKEGAWIICNFLWIIQYLSCMILIVSKAFQLKIRLFS